MSIVPKRRADTTAPIKLLKIRDMIWPRRGGIRPLRPESYELSEEEETEDDMEERIFFVFCFLVGFGTSIIKLKIEIVVEDEIGYFIEC